MGMYTELNLKAELKADTPNDIIIILQYMISSNRDENSLIGLSLDHELFQTDRWRFMLNCDSAYFSADTNSTLRYEDNYSQYILNIQCNFKNYDKELQKFLDWILPYIDEIPGTYLGHSNEESREPTLIYMQEGKHEY